MLELLAVILAIPGAIEALRNLWTLRRVGGDEQRSSTTVLDVSLHFSIRRKREAGPSSYT